MFAREELQKMTTGWFIADSEKERIQLARQCLEMMDVVDAARELLRAADNSSCCSMVCGVARDALDKLDKGNAPPNSATPGLVTSASRMPSEA